MDEPSFILFLADELLMRGATADTLLLARGLPHHGFRVQLIAQNAQQLSTELRRQLDLRQIAHMSTPLIHRAILRLLQAEFENKKPDLIHVHSRRLLNAANRLSAHWKIPLVITIQDDLNPRDLFCMNLSAGGCVITVSESVRKHFLDNTNFDPGLVRVIPSGVESKSESGSDELLLDPARRAVIGTAGALEEIKGVHFFLGAAQKVLIRFPETMFLVSGTGPEEHRLRELARALGMMSKVTFVPRLKDFSAAIQAMDIFCLPSLRQGLGTIMLQAMGQGRPVIATNTGGVASVVTNRANGLIVPAEDVDALADGMIELLSKPDWARELGEAARLLVRREFGVERMLERTAEVYRELIPPKVKNRSHAALESAN
ncbi:MAG TPA: glycosyltransferase family 4 protein [Planctomycetaceae bacterium]|nr:glycosyltransferase family 4 protein [Planctomycetaceae bacterium]